MKTTAAWGLLLALIGIPFSFAAPKHRTLPITDDFVGHCKWPVGETEAFSYKCDRGVYRMRLKKGGPVHVTRSFGFTADAVSLEAEATVESGRRTKAGMALLGIGCLAGESRGYVAYLKTGVGWGISRLDKELKALKTGSFAGTSAGVAASYRLRIDCAPGGSNITAVRFFVSDQQVGSAEDAQAPVPFDGAALYVDTFPGVVAWRQFAARSPSSGAKYASSQRVEPAPPAYSMPAIGLESRPIIPVRRPVLLSAGRFTYSWAWEDCSGRGG